MLSAALSQHHLLGFEIAQLEFPVLRAIKDIFVMLMRCLWKVCRHCKEGTLVARRSKHASHVLYNEKFIIQNHNYFFTNLIESWNFHSLRLQHRSPRHHLLPPAPQTQHFQ